MKQFLTIPDASDAELTRVFDAAYELRGQREAGEANPPLLEGQTLAMLFEKPSLRTRVSFEQAMIELGGHAIVLGQHEVGLGKRESVADATRVLAGMVHGIAARVFEHRHLEEMAAHSPVPVINMLSDEAHPCQALADVMTIMDEFGRDLSGRHVAFVGDGNNVARSLALLAARFGMRFTLAAPQGFAFDSAFIAKAKAAGADPRVMADPVESVRDADVVVTDTFVSMGQEAERARRKRAFEGYQLNEALLERAPAHAIVLHCLPAYRGEEITDEVMDGPRSRVFPEAHNRLHAQKGLLAVLMGGR